MGKLILLGCVLAGVSLLGCHREPAEGPMEHAGKEVDHAAHKTKKGVEKGVEKTGEAAEKAGDKIGDATRDDH